MKRLEPADLKDNVIDGHAHAGVSLREYMRLGFPYCQDVEGLVYRQKANGVDASVVFPLSADLYFDLHQLRRSGRCTPARKPLTEAPFATENRMLFREVYDFCPEHTRRLLPFACLDPRRDVPGQLRVLQEIEREYPIYGFKILPVSLQVTIRNLLGAGKPLLDFARERNLPFLFHVTTHPDEHWSQASDSLEIARRNPDLRFCFAHCCGFDAAMLKQIAAQDNVWVDTAALKIQVELAASGDSVMAPPKKRVPSDYSSHKKVIRTLAEMMPTRLIWASDSPAYSYICDRPDSSGRVVQFRLKATYEDEKAALDSLPKRLRKRVGSQNAIDFLFGCRGRDQTTHTT